MATGKQIDPRNASYVPSLMTAVKEAGLEENFLMPGMIPYEDLMPLMQASTALLNPSLFEGWSTTVEEARAAGVPMILSDIAVHREQGGGKATFFDPNSVDSLAEALSNFKTLSAEHRQSLRDEATLKSIELVYRFANEFVELVKATAAKNRTQ
jgi:glycosyltransferase involved in cell wall biosynthesis